MKSKIFIALIFFITGLCLAQQSNFNKDVELQKFVERGGKVEETSPNIYKLTYRNGIQRFFNFNTTPTQSNSFIGIDTTVINVWEIDTTKFSGMFKFWQKVEVSNVFWGPPPIEDLNSNGEPEIYGFTDAVDTGAVPWAGPVKIYELGLNGIFQNIYTYDDSTVYVHGIGDMNNDGVKNIFISTSYPNKGKVYSADSANSLPTSFKYYFYSDSNQINNVAFDDFDKNGMVDLAFIKGAGEQTCIISEYRESTNNFETVYELKTLDQGDLSGFAIDDFDGDGKTELVIGGGFGKVLVIENSKPNIYDTTWSIDYLGWAAYMQAVTQDIDKNGKKEFWVGAEDLLHGVSVFHCFESTGNDTYQEVASLIFPGLVALFTMYLQSVDIDDDGTEELVISIGNTIVMLKFAGSQNEHKYKVYFLKIGESTQQGAVFFPCAITDLNSDNKKDILIPMEKNVSIFSLEFSYILRNTDITSVEEEPTTIPEDIRLSIYPNPFNSTTTINFVLKKTSDVQIKIFNYLGKEITTFLDKELAPGNYTINWAAKDKSGSSLPSGFYLVNLRANNTVKNVKTVLLK